MIKACIFDMDGTILNTITAITHYVNMTLLHFGIDTISEDEAKIFVGDGAKKLIERTLSAKGESEPELLKRVLDYYNESYDKAPLYLTEPYSGIPELIDALHKDGIRLAILSNKPDFVTRPIGEHFFGNKMDFIRGAVEGVPLKPSPEALYSLMDDMGVMPCECAYIGDTSVDMKTGKAADVALTIGVIWGFRSLRELQLSGADVIVSEPYEIAEQIRKINKNTFSERI